MEEALLARLLAVAGVTDIVGQANIVWGRRVGLTALALHLVTDRPDYHLEGPSGLSESVVQIDCWAPTFGQARVLGRAVALALGGWAGGLIHRALIDATRTSFEPGDGAANATSPADFHRTSLDVRVWHRAA